MFVAVIMGCDIVKNDVTPNNAIVADLYTFAEQPVVLNVTATAGGKNVAIRNLSAPAFGKYEQVSHGNRQYLVYSPNQTFKGKEEELDFDLYESTASNALQSVKLKIGSLDGRITQCDGISKDKVFSGLYDYAKLKSGEKLVIDVLDNDLFCGVGYNGGVVSGYALENATDEDFQISLGPGRQVSFEYTAPVGFTGKVRIIYEVGINWKTNPPENIGVEEILSDPYTYLEAFTTALVEIDVVD